MQPNLIKLFNKLAVSYFITAGFNLLDRVSRSDQDKTLHLLLK